MAAEVWSSNLVVKVKEPEPSEYGLLRADLILLATCIRGRFPN
jgi:alanine dehydrogenase